MTCHPPLPLCDLKVYFVMMLTFVQSGVVVIIASAVVGIILVTMPDDQSEAKRTLAIVAMCIGTALYVFLVAFFVLAIAGLVYRVPCFSRVATVFCGRPDNTWRPYNILHTRVKREVS
jgi:hypothetical protein